MANATPENKIDLTIKINVPRESSDDALTSVDAKTVGKLLLALPEMINEFHSKNEANEHLLVKARPFANGSFEIPLELILIGISTLLMTGPDYILQKIQAVIDRIRQFIEIKQKLKGEPLNIQGENVVVIENSTISLDSVVFNIFNSDNSAEEKFREAINELRQDSTIQSLELQVGQEKKTFASIQATQFDYFTTKAKIVEKMVHEGEKVSTKRVRLKLKETDFAGTAKWKFYYNSKIISVGMQDEHFIAQVKESEQRFGAEDELDVDLEIYEVYDEESQQFKESKYFIQKVHYHHIRKPTNAKMLFDLEGE